MKIAIGIMSGTSLDGVDVVVVKIKGTFTDSQIEVIDFKTFPINREMKARIKAQFLPATSDIKSLTSLNFEISQLYAKYVKTILRANNIEANDVSFVASHGQTIYHIPVKTTTEVASTLQLGDGSVLANILKINTISNFRTADIALGGQGAPLVPYADFCLFKSDKTNRIMLNIGGISNITYLKKGAKLDDVIAFDTGPGNMIINYFVEKLYQIPYDNQGLIARSGKIVEPLLKELLADSYLQQLPPKTTGRERYGDFYAEQLLNKYQNCPKEDLVATVTHFTAEAIKTGCKLVASDLTDFELIASGGGAHNLYLLEIIQKLMPELKVLTTADFKMDVDAKEAIAFTILGNETLRGKPSNVKSATGAREPVILGQISFVK